MMSDLKDVKGIDVYNYSLFHNKINLPVANQPRKQEDLPPAGHAEA